MHKKCVLLLTLFFFNNAYASRLLTIKSCSDETPIFPQLFGKTDSTDLDKITQTNIIKNTEQGLYIDILNEVKNKMNIAGVDLIIDFKFYPWERCLKLLEKGHIDFILAASYNAERAEFADYPEGAKAASEKKECVEHFQIDCSAYRVITLKENDYKYEKDQTTLPKPVRATKGFSIVKDLKKLDYDVEVSKNDGIGIQKLLRDKTGSVIVYNDSLTRLLMDKEISDKITVHEHAFVKKSYFTPFSKKSTVSEPDKKLFWETLDAVYRDKKLVTTFLEKY